MEKEVAVKTGAAVVLVWYARTRWGVEIPAEVAVVLGSDIIRPIYDRIVEVLRVLSDAAIARIRCAAERTGAGRPAKLETAAPPEDGATGATSGA